jgi:hypothetical protein
VRLRTALSAIEEWLIHLEESCETPARGDPPYEQVIDDPDPPSYPWSSRAQQEVASRVLADLRTLGQVLGETPPNEMLRHDAPRPLPEVQLRPRI